MASKKLAQPNQVPEDWELFVSANAAVKQILAARPRAEFVNQALNAALVIFDITQQVIEAPQAHSAARPLVPVELPRLERIVAAAHGETLSKQDRYKQAVATIGCIARLNDGGPAGAVVLIEMLTELDRRFADCTLERVTELLNACVADDVKATKGHCHGSGVLARLCVETGALDSQKFKQGTQPHRAAVEKLATEIRIKCKKPGTKALG